MELAVTGLVLGARTASACAGRSAARVNWARELGPTGHPPYARARRRVRVSGRDYTGVLNTIFAVGVAVHQVLSDALFAQQLLVAPADVPHAAAVVAIVGFPRARHLQKIRTRGKAADTYQRTSRD